MARITIDDCLKRIPNRFDLTLAATYRARQLASGATRWWKPARTSPPCWRCAKWPMATSAGKCLIAIAAETDGATGERARRA